uniref:DM13 domain-containing protein n=1 Tax=Rhabditophanes sp. KR3021 TaxID=114890 RepID=A0AC35U4K7_9BILA
MPVGAIYYGHGQMSGEVYAGDMKTLYVKRFMFNTKMNGCFALMLGPAKESELEQPYTVGHYGILLKQTGINDFEASNTINERVKRSSSTSVPTDSNSHIKGPRNNSEVKSSEKRKIDAEIDEGTSGEEGLIKSYEKMVRQLSEEEKILSSKPSEGNSSIQFKEQKDGLFEKEEKIISIFKASDELRFHPKKLSDSLIDISSKTMVPTNPNNESNSTNNLVETSNIKDPSGRPLYWVIDDPRAKRKKELSDTYKQKGANTLFRRKNVALATKTVYRFDPIYQLVSVNNTNQLIALKLPDHANLTDYKWVGVYDQCVQKAVPLITLNDVDPPSPENIAPISGWSHGIVSYTIKIINCNTILIPGFSFNATSAFSQNTYFYAGIGKFPQEVLMQQRAYVNKNRITTPLQSFFKEDIIVRLPGKLRTFDIDFLSIYNEDEKKSYGNIILPSVLVPPCPV